MYLESPLLLYLFALLWNNAHVAMVLHSTYYALLASCFTPLLVFLVYLAYQTTVGTIVKCKKVKRKMIPAQWICWKRIIPTIFMYLFHTSYRKLFFRMGNFLPSFDKPSGTILYWLSMLSFQFLLFGSLFIIVPFKWFPWDITFLLATCYLTIRVLENPFSMIDAISIKESSWIIFVLLYNITLFECNSEIPCTNCSWMVHCNNFEMSRATE